jgi:hypothetical protein
MKFFPAGCSLLLLTTTSCIFGQGSSEPAPGPLEWPQGVFVLSGTVQYARATGTGQSTATDVYEATLTIGLDDYMTLETNTGMCTTIDPNDVQRQLARGFRSFSCGDVQFSVSPAGSSVRGQLTATVPTLRRERGGCIRWNDEGACMEYSYNYREGSTRKGTSLRVQKVG